MRNRKNDSLNYLFKLRHWMSLIYSVDSVNDSSFIYEQRTLNKFKKQQ